MHWLLAHFIGDWLMQPDALALHKKDSQWKCFIHVLIYMIPFLFVPGLVGWKWSLIALQHFVIDSTDWLHRWLTLTGHHRFIDETAVMYPLGYVVCDQIVHIAWIYFVMGL